MPEGVEAAAEAEVVEVEAAEVEAAEAEVVEADTRACQEAAADTDTRLAGLN